MNTVLHQSNPNLVSNDSETQANKNSITIGTQTDNLSNIGNGTGPLDPNRADNPFGETQPGENPIQLSNLHKVLNKHFIAEATKLDNQSTII